MINFDKQKPFKKIVKKFNKKRIMKFNAIEKKTLVLLLISSFFDGFVISAFKMQDIIAKKALNVLDWQLTILVMLWPISNLFSIWWGKALEKAHSFKKYFILTALAGRLSLLLMLWIEGFSGYFLILLLLFSFNALIIPARNAIYQSNINVDKRGKIFGYQISLTTLTMIISSYFAGRFLDANENLFRYFFVIVGIMGCFSSLILAFISLDREKAQVKEKINLRQIFIKPIQRTWEVLKKDRDYAIFQRNFFIYGIAFLILLPIIPKYLVEYLQFNYSQTFFCKVILAELAILILAPLTGTIHDKKNPAYFSSIAFFILSLYPIILLISSYLSGNVYVNYIIYLAFIIFGIGMSSVVISWNISSIYFAGEEDASMYQSVHVTLTGIRGLIIPPLGYLILKLFGINTVFIISAVVFIIAGILNFKLYLQISEQKDYFSKKIKKMQFVLRKGFPL